MYIVGFACQDLPEPQLRPYHTYMPAMKPPLLAFGGQFKKRTSEHLDAALLCSGWELPGFCGTTPPKTPKKCDWKAKTDFEGLSHFFSLMSKGPIWDVLSIKETVFFWYVRESITGITTALQKRQDGIRFWPETRSFCSFGLCWQEGARSAEWHKSLPSKTGTRRSAQRSACYFHRHSETINPVFHLE